MREEDSEMKYVYGIILFFEFLDILCYKGNDSVEKMLVEVMIYNMNKMS